MLVSSGTPPGDRVQGDEVTGERADGSLANPWLDFLPGTEDTLKLTKRLNDDLQEICLQHATKLWAFGILPSATSPVSAWLDTLHHISTLPRIKGIILGTKGLGNGLDDPAMDPIWKQLEKSKLMIFIHPHYGIQKSLYGEQENGHVLPLALGFPFETTIVPPATLPPPPSPPKCDRGR